MSLVQPPVQPLNQESVIFLIQWPTCYKNIEENRKESQILLFGSH